jgi:two-component system LytT family response regulator/two-component system response regulator LytT
MKKIAVLVVDDELIMCAALRHHLEKFPHIEVVGECHDGHAALLAVEQLNPDLVFLDIRMPGLNGLEVAATLDQLESSPQIVFVTAHDDYALKAFEVGALDYVLKPFDSSDIIRVLRKIRRARTTDASSLHDSSGPTQPVSLLNRPSKFCLYYGEKQEIIESRNIKLFTVEHGKTFAQTIDDHKYSAKQSLHEIEQLLDPGLFFRCHRNFIVNIDWVKSVSPWFNRGLLLTLKGDKKIEVPVSRAQTKKLEQYIHF